MTKSQETCTQFISNKDKIEQIIKTMLFHHGEPYATSNQIAKYFDIRHDDLLRKIRLFHSFDELISLRKISERNRIVRGKEYPYFELDADAFSFTCLSITGKKAESFKWAFIQAFKQATSNAISARVAIETNKANTDWIAAREQGKSTRKLLQNKIKEFCLYAEKQRGRSYSSCPYYKLITNAIYSCLGIDISKKGATPRDIYSGNIVEAIEHAELKVIELLDDIMVSKGTRKGIQHQIARKLKYVDVA
ncbi:Rha family transcriptional regulator [Sulfurovum sp. XTW-4]|uniref:Rha family transcriptional regulator n=1 Tax=Sulfurovum xiamenensis TaxID=3019066 RepID=A0ABT7QU15_9BACT|nr:Rha family transcriptional regulator [Sulfurovum xiamenensis]MDM5264563.1 Rha family transcriptional regulator [Sulfurovum xiamenensis]